MVGDARLYTARSSLLRGPDYLLGIDRRAAHGFPERYVSRYLESAPQSTLSTGNPGHSWELFLVRAQRGSSRSEQCQHRKCCFAPSRFRNLTFVLSSRWPLL